MVNWIEARQRESDKRFDMTVESDESSKPNAYPIGYCAGWTEAVSDRHEPHLKKLFEAEREKRRPFQAKYHTEGHATKGEAHECWESFQLDQNLKNRDDANDQRKCEICGEWTQHRVGLVGPYSFCDEYAICARHPERESVAETRKKKRMTPHRAG